MMARGLLSTVFGHLACAAFVGCSGSGDSASGAASDTTSQVDAAATAGTALDPHVALPTHDCRTDTSTNCISIAGTFDGAPVDVFCNDPHGLQIIVHAGTWGIGCDQLPSGVGIAQLYIPIQEPGPIALTFAPGAKPLSEFNFSTDLDKGSVDLFTSNLSHAEVAGDVVASGSSYRAVSGTLHGTWTDADAASCSGLYGATCRPANLNVTYRSYTRYGTCLGDAECIAPQKCDTVGYFCSSL
jgi:hypothetical protein